MKLFNTNGRHVSFICGTVSLLAVWNLLCPGFCDHFWCGVVLVSSTMRRLDAWKEEQKYIFNGTLHGSYVAFPLLKQTFYRDLGLYNPSFHLPFHRLFFPSNIQLLKVLNWFYSHKHPFVFLWLWAGACQWVSGKLCVINSILLNM